MAKDQETLESDKMLDICIYDYLVKRKLHSTAEAFIKEANVSTDKSEIDDPADFFWGWWTVFWDMNNAKRNKKHSEAAAVYTKMQKMKKTEQQQKQQLLLMQKRGAQSQIRDNNHHAFGGSISGMNSKGTMRLPREYLVMNMIEERMKQSNSMYPEASQTYFGANRMVFSNAETSHKGFNQIVHDNPGNISTMQQIENLGLALDQVDPTNYHDMNPSIFSGPIGGSLSAKNGQSSNNRVSIGTQVQPGSTKDNRKRKHHSSSTAANVIVAQTKHKISDEMMPSSSFQQDNNAEKCAGIVFGIEGAEGLASPSIILPKNKEQLGDDGFFDNDLQSLLLSNLEDGDNLNGIINQSHIAEQQKENPKDFTFSEFACARTCCSKVTCCHFSSDGKFLASAGNNKVVLWNMDTLQTESMPEEHKLTILDVCFRPNSSQLATASADKSVRIWDAANPSHSMQQYCGHKSAIMSVDFHPNKTDLFCFSDSENEVQYWNMTTSSFVGGLKGGNAQVRFQPGVGELLAAASDNGISIFNIETGIQIYSLQGNPEVVDYICWGANGDVLASVSRNFVKLWSLSSGECIKGLRSSEEEYHSCVFHPSYSNILVLGATSGFEMWNIGVDRSMLIPAEQNIISCLAQSPVTGIVASGSHDCTVKLWK